MSKFFVLIFTLFFIPLSALFAQQEDYQIGINQTRLNQNTGALYDYSDPNGINIKVAIWGYVKYPGRYILPSRTDVKDLISYAGGIDDNAFLDDLRIYRVNPDSTQSLIKVDFEELWSGDNLKKYISLSRLQAGDILIVPGRPRLYWENYFNLALSSLGFLISIATLIITATK